MNEPRFPNVPALSYVQSHQRRRQPNQKESADNFHQCRAVQEDMTKLISRRHFNHARARIGDRYDESTRIDFLLPYLLVPIFVKDKWLGMVPDFDAIQTSSVRDQSDFRSLPRTSGSVESSTSNAG